MSGKSSTATHSFRREKIGEVTKNQDEKWFDEDILPNLNAQDYTSMFNFSITLNVAVVVEYTQDGTTFIPMNGGKTIPANQEYTWSLMSANGDLINLRTQDDLGADIQRVLVSEAFSQTLPERTIPVLPTDLTLDIQKGAVPGAAIITRLGENTAIADVNFVDISAIEANLIYLNSAETMDIVSTDANDTVAGSGAQLLLITGLDDNYDAIAEIIALDGLTPVTTTLSFLRIDIMFVVDVGVLGGTNTGVITATASTALTTQSVMPIDKSISISTLFTVPRGHTLFIDLIGASLGKGNDAQVGVFIRPFSGIFTDPFVNAVTFNVFEQETSVDAPEIPFGEKSEFALRATRASGGPITVVGSLVAVLYDNRNLP